MAPKSLLTPALRALHKTKVTTTSTRIPVSVRHLRPNAKKNNAASDSPTMGRAGYDTTNMKVATRPRLAGKGTGTCTSGTHSGKHASSSAPPPPPPPPQQRGEGVGGTSDGALGKAQASEKKAAAEFHYKIPTGREVEGHNPVDDDLPVPPLVGRGWTFWL